MQDVKETTQVGPGQAGESHTASAVSSHRIMGGAPDCKVDSLMPRFSARMAADLAPNPQAANNAPTNPTLAATNAPFYPTPAATHAPIPTTRGMPPANLWQQSVVRSSSTHVDNNPDRHDKTDTGKDDRPGSSKEVGDRKRGTREGNSQREARSDAEGWVRVQPRVRAERGKGLNTGPRDRPQAREGETQRDKRPDVRPRDQLQVREGETQREKWPDADPSERGKVREGATQREEPPQAKAIAGAAARPQDTDTTYTQPRRTRGKRSHAPRRALPAPNAQPGTSNPKPVPSGTGPGKRTRPDDTASPSTLQGDAKRVRVHSAQEGQRTYARATKDIPARLAVAICLPHPSRELTRDEAEHIKTALEDRLLDSDPSTPLPAFRGYPRVADGTVQIWCEDDNALTWLTQNVPLIRLPDNDQTLTVLRQTDVPTRVRASLFVPRYRGEMSRLHGILTRQNSWYDISRWSLYKATTIGGDRYGTYLTLGLPPEEAEKVAGRERRISYLLGSIYVRFWPTTRPTDTQTDSTQTTNPTTTTQTGDTDIAQLEEEMARAAMADDDDTVPAASPGWNDQLLASSPGDIHDDDKHQEVEAEGLSDGSVSN